LHGGERRTQGVTKMIRTLWFAFLALSLQANAAVVGFEPSTITVKEGETFELAVRGSGFDTSLDGGGFDLAVEFASVVQVLDIVLDEETWDPALSSPGDISDAGDAVTGTNFAQFGGPVGDFPILVYRFVADGVGTSRLILTANSDFVSGLDTVPVDFPVIGTVHVIPEPAAAWMLIAGLALIALLRIRRT
jgi:hypothetical protein